MPSRDVFPTILAVVDCSPTFALASLVKSLEKCVWSSVLININLLPFDSLGEGGGGGVINKALYGEAPPQGPTSYTFMCCF